MQVYTCVSGHRSTHRTEGRQETCHQLMKYRITFWGITIGMLIGLPLFGVASGGADIRPYLEFPPLTRYVDHAPFDAKAFALIAIVDLLMVCGLIHLFRSAYRRSGPYRRPKGHFPLWGWMGVAVMATGWLMAWTRFPWFEALQPHTFCMPWVGYVILVNALCIARSGRSLMTDAPAKFALLWPASALFWWFFEYLNRFVQNWYYVGVTDFSPVEYVFHASLAFATVLPAVLSTHRLLLTYGTFHTGLKPLISITFMDDKRTAGGICLVSGLCLTLIGRHPDLLYPLVWGAPLLVITSLQTLKGAPTIFRGLASGDWRALIGAAVAALICGFFWELWNYHSLAKWEYAIPYVDRFHIFEMPVLGYGGYLPFGLECLLVGQMVLGNRLLALPGD